ncbi:hypothetical protein GQ55_5G103200 [Panicum hallii var. hallii]|uniref:Transcription factor CBF/NF-Y/archaeal histone domain-containing protein n=2 Tax=Panicum hallii TaxID=206008 RepID=A0A2T7DEX3_9POAL|nr:hypothetical protein GQ55_5G103200 [Panicum hallii var. hallii]
MGPPAQGPLPSLSLFAADERPGYPGLLHRTHPDRLLFSSVRSPFPTSPLSAATSSLSLFLLPSPFSPLLASPRARFYKGFGGGARSQAMADDGGSHEGGGGGGVREQDRFLPIANISRIMKKAVPANGKIAKDAKETLQECVSEFISFVTSEASDKCQKEKRKTINGDDLLWAMATLGFEEYVEPLKMYLQKYREMEGDSKLSTKAGEGSVKKDAISPHGGTSSSSNQLVQHGVYNQGMGYMQPQYHNGDT